MAKDNLQTIEAIFAKDLQISQVATVKLIHSFISSLLGLTPKHNGGWHCIHYLSYLSKTSVNNWISNLGNLQYTKFHKIFDLIRRIGQGAIIFKSDIKNAFCNISVALHNQWLLSFEWNRQFYKETCLFFGLSITLFLFNLFTEALH